MTLKIGKVVQPSDRKTMMYGKLRIPAGTILFNHLNMSTIYRGYCSIIENISWSLRDILINYWGLPDQFKYWSIIEVPSEILFNLLRCLPLSSIYRGDIEVYCGNIDQYTAERPRYILNYRTISTVYCEHIEVIEQFCASRDWEKRGWPCFMKNRVAQSDKEVCTRY